MTAAAQQEQLMRFLADSIRTVEANLKKQTRPGSAPRIRGETFNPPVKSKGPEPALRFADDGGRNGRRATSDILAWRPSAAARQQRENGHSQLDPLPRPAARLAGQPAAVRASAPGPVWRAVTKQAQSNQGPAAVAVAAVAPFASPQQQQQGGGGGGGRPPPGPGGPSPGAALQHSPSLPAVPGSVPRRLFGGAPASEAGGSHADWWRYRADSKASYPTTAVTDKKPASVTSTEFKMWLARMEKLEAEVKEERQKRKVFEQELHQLQRSDEARSGPSNSVSNKATDGMYS